MHHDDSRVIGPAVRGGRKVVGEGGGWEVGDGINRSRCDKVVLSLCAGNLSLAQ